ncbi:hypothetical protein F5884DRAFT_756050 [Xylogone sp. PMI_703]|nr:hypothetical protein F5884DRAFT_756050 [Xylogone sp. PMI_703]
MVTTNPDHGSIYQPLQDVVKIIESLPNPELMMCHFKKVDFSQLDVEKVISEYYEELATDASSDSDSDSDQDVQPRKEAQQKKKNGVIVHTQLQPGEIEMLVKFFFHDVFGEGFQERLYRLVDETQAESSVENADDAGVLAEKHAQDVTLFPEVRTFFQRYSTWHRKEREITNIIPSIQQALNAYNLYLSWAELREKAGRPDGSELRDFLAEQGFRQSQGVDMRTCVLRYLCKMLNVTRNQLSNNLHAQVGIHHMVHTFGLGILVFLPKWSAISRLGHQKMENILTTLVDALPQSKILCKVAEDTILRPIRLGMPIPLLKASQAEIRPTLTILEAVSPLAKEETNTTVVESPTSSYQFVSSRPSAFAKRRR